MHIQDLYSYDVIQDMQQKIYLPQESVLHMSPNE